MFDMRTYSYRMNQFSLAALRSYLRSTEMTRRSLMQPPEATFSTTLDASLRLQNAREQ